MAYNSLKTSPWARAAYDDARARKQHHHRALRGLGDSTNRHTKVGSAQAAHDGSDDCRYNGAYRRPVDASSGLAGVLETFGILDSRSPAAGVRHGPKGNGSR